MLIKCLVFKEIIEIICEIFGKLGMIFRKSNIRKRNSRIIVRFFVKDGRF